VVHLVQKGQRQHPWLPLEYLDSAVWGDNNDFTSERIESANIMATRVRLAHDELLNRIIPLRGKRPAFLEFRSSKAFILLAVCWSVFTVSKILLSQTPCQP
jgi:hypothetical protein